MINKQSSSASDGLPGSAKEAPKGAKAEKPPIARKIVRIEDLPEDFDETIYANERDGQVKEIIAKYRERNTEEQKAKEKRARMQRFLSNKDKSKLGIAEAEGAGQKPEDCLAVAKTNLYGIPENEANPSIIHSPNRLHKVGAHYSRIKRPANLGEGRVSFTNVDSDRYYHDPMNQVSDDAIGHVCRGCTVCKHQVQEEKLHCNLHKMPDQLKLSLTVIEREKNYEKFGGFRRDFTWFIEQLLPCSDRIKGCEMIFPDTLFIKDGKPAFIAKMDTDFCLSAIKNRTKVSLDKVYSDFSDWHKE